ncbi:ROK family protein [Pontibacter sp. E15-1]|uniref:ROK family protein n=1 Tax=Pontibacter sp. E15-1 TaxID=2919918 RepID=UPI001F4FA612|nr:ROK family protein [Pontibacter sp. E15-1]MCJ8164380.1 ROK family protein [Pontibacter sp. E15-1]
MSHETIVGVDIGGSHITSALVALQTSSIVPGTRARALVNAAGTVQEVLDSWCSVIKETLGTLPLASTKLGVSMPGPFEYEEGICLFQNQSKYDCLYGLNVKSLLAEQLGMDRQHIKLQNDAGCFLRGEVAGGAARAVSSAMGFTLGTGLGSAMLADGVAADADLWRAPFKDSIAEEYLSTRAFVQAYQRLSGKTVPDVKALAARCPHDADARQVFQGFAEDLALFLEPYLRQHTPEAVIIGGNIANAWELFMPITKRALAARGLTVPIYHATLAEDAALIGAASSWRAAPAALKPRL